MSIVPMKPEDLDPWRKAGITIKLDGDRWCATGPGFVNLQESPAGFGDTIPEAIGRLLEEALRPTKKPEPVKTPTVDPAEAPKGYAAFPGPPKGAHPCEVCAFKDDTASCLKDEAECRASFRKDGCEVVFKAVPDTGV